MTLTGDAIFDGSRSTYQKVVLSAEGEAEERLLTRLVGFLNTGRRFERLAKLIELCDGLAAEEEAAQDLEF